MPARDGTGPRGLGTRTGRGLGNCAPGTFKSIISSGKNSNLLGLGMQLLGAFLGSRRKPEGSTRQNLFKK